MANFYPAANSDDFWGRPSYALVDDTSLVLGNNGAISCTTYMRFANIAIPQGSSIVSAYIIANASGTNTNTTCNVNIFGNYVDSPSVPADYNSMQALELTSAVAWNGIEGWTGGTLYNSVDIKDIIQAIISRPGWVSGNPLAILFKDNGSSINAVRALKSRNSGATYPQLVITYDAMVTVQEESSDESIENVKVTEYNGPNIVTYVADISTAISAENITVKSPRVMLASDLVSISSLDSAPVAIMCLISDISSPSSVENVINYVTNYYDFNEELPLLVCEAIELTGEIHAGEVIIPMLTIGATVISGNISQGDCILPAIGISAQMSNMISFSNSLPLIEIDAYSFGPLVSTLNEELPLFSISAFLVNNAVFDTNTKCLVFNTNTNAMTEYDNFPFNSFCTFNGKQLGACSSGIMLLEGDSDAGVDIEAAFNFGVNDFGIPNLKRFSSDIYASIKGDGEYSIKVTSDNGDPYDYPLSGSGDRTHTLKAKVGKGQKGRYFEIEFSNIGGSDFKLQDIVFDVEASKRRI